MFHDRRFNYVLLPLFISNYTYREKLFNFYINGATGRIAGRYPKSAAKIFGIILFGIALVAGVGAALWFGGII